MSYASRKRYRSRRERNKQTWRNIRIVLIAMLGLFFMYIIKNRITIKDHLSTYLM